MTKIQQYVIIHNIAVYPFMIAMVIEDGPGISSDTLG